MSIKLIPKTKYEAEKVTRLPDDKLRKSYKELADWLTNHMAETGTNNKIDVSGDPYNHEVWEAKLHELEHIEDEFRRRNITDF